MNIDLESLTDRELGALLSAAFNEWQLRQRSGTGARVQPLPAPALQQEAPAEQPSEDEKDFMLHVKTRLLRRALILASDRQAFRELARKYPEWTRRQGLPSDPGGSEGRNWRERHVTFEPAPERR